ncbi:predicted protein [Nematostella vectensis]|uniref:Ig-like domain-containing protein n=1 Tax=Nematostella vectensis TaxID=45351 RepID=A7RTI8_NEMVE|nr:predicted protein [Nematostella vectensis]|eukprot:XP_001637286.1 predicted protein [Nematostella vectensis]
MLLPLDTVVIGDKLRLLSIKRWEEGNYTCNASNEIGKAAIAHAQIHVDYVSVIDMNFTSLYTASWYGHIVTLRCRARSKPTPHITWYGMTGNQTLCRVMGTEGESTLTFTSRDEWEYGAYKCRAINHVGHVKTNITVTKLYVSVIDMNFTSLYTASWYGHIVTLRCRARSKPTPHITWYGTTGNQTLCRVMGTEGESTLTFTSRDEWEYGAYKCRAINHVGHVETNITVTKFVRKIAAYLYLFSYGSFLELAMILLY